MTRRKPYNKMTAAELADSTREFDRETDLSTLRPMTPAEDRAFRASQKATLKRSGKSSRPVVFHISPDLLARAERVAVRQGISPSELLERGLLSALAILDRPTRKSA